MLRSRTLSFAIAGAAALLLTLASLLPYGAFNQTTYLVDPLHRAMPELFGRDWFVHTPSYMPVFGWLAQWLYRIDPEGPTAFLTTHVAVMMASCVALYWLASMLSRDVRLFLIVAAFTTSNGVAIGGSYLFAGYLQPSSLATLGWLVAMAALVRGRYLACGLALAAAGAVHLNFLLLGVGLFLLVAVGVREASRWDYVKLLIPQLVVIAWFLPTLAEAAGPNAEQLTILIKFHAPLHYSPFRLLRWIPAIVAWQIAAYAALQLVEPRRELRVLWWFSLVATFVIVATTLVMQLPTFAWLTQMFWSRMAPFGQLACQLIVAAALVDSRRLSGVRRVAIGSVLVGGLVIAQLYTRTSVALSLLGAVLVALALVPRLSRPAMIALATATIGGALWFGPRGSGLTTTPYASRSEQSLMRWVREQTPQDALFLTPPNMGRFRLLARRSIVADTKSPPLRPDLLVAWYHRLCAMVGLPDVANVPALAERYAALTPVELVAIARAFDVDYIVVAGRLPAVAEYANANFAVYRTKVVATGP